MTIGWSIQDSEAVTGPGIRLLTAPEAKYVAELAEIYEDLGSSLNENGMQPGADFWKKAEGDRLAALKLRVKDLRAAMKKQIEREAK